MSASVRVAVPKAPAAPTNLVATPVSTTKIGLTWSTSVSGGLTVQYYHVFRGTSPASMPQIATITQTSYTDTPGSPATKYYYAVQAIDSGGDLSPMSATVSATTMGLPSAPTKLIVAATSKTQISLSWTAGPSGMPISSFQVFRGSSAANLAPLKRSPAGTTSITDYPVTAGTTYYYGVQETDTGGNVSPMSTVVSVTTPTK
jgi:fibronectin type 3 domain-containing protein